MTPTLDFFQVADALKDSFFLAFSALFFLSSAAGLLIGLWLFTMSSSPEDDKSSVPLIRVCIGGLLASAALFWLVGALPSESQAVKGHALAQIGLYAVIFGASHELAWLLFRKGRTMLEDYSASKKDSVVFPRIVGLSASFFSLLGGSSAIVIGLFLS